MACWSTGRLACQGVHLASSSLAGNTRTVLPSDRLLRTSECPCSIGQRRGLYALPLPEQGGLAAEIPISWVLASSEAEEANQVEPGQIGADVLT